LFCMIFVEVILTQLYSDCDIRASPADYYLPYPIYFLSLSPIILFTFLVAVL